VDYIISEELPQRIQHFDFLGEFIAQCIASAGRTIELAPGYKVIMPSIMVDLQRIATLHSLKPSVAKMKASECLEPSWRQHPRKDELGFAKRLDLVEWRRTNAPDLPFYNAIMTRRKQTLERETARRARGRGVSDDDDCDDNDEDDY
jgi:hypothetical protein